MTQEWTLSALFFENTGNKKIRPREYLQVSTNGHWKVEEWTASKEGKVQKQA